MELNTLINMLTSQLNAGNTTLTESEGYSIIEEMGIAVPRNLFIDCDDWMNADWNSLKGEKLVLKISSREILHKSDWGGVAFVPNDRQAVQKAMKQMADRASCCSWDGFLLMECVSFEKSLGHEWLLGFRLTPDFGPVVILGPGGIYTEYLAKAFKSDNLLSVFSATLHKNEGDVLAELKRNSLLPLISGGMRGQAAELEPEFLARAIFKMLSIGNELVKFGLNEMEINPLVVIQGTVMALDALVKIAKPVDNHILPRPIEKIEFLLKPKSIGLIGVSEKMNPGKIILHNMLKCGFQKKDITIVKKGTNSIDGCLCVPEIEQMPGKVDLMVLSVSADQVPKMMSQIISCEKAESVILIPGGLEEKEGTRHLVQGMKDQLRESRLQPWKGPIINGGNCVGVRSAAGHYDTLFIPRHKISPAGDIPTNLALISQSGAYLVSLLDRMTDVSPIYSISLGNQSDLTIADYLTFLKDDPDVKVFGIYGEGLKPGDGQRLLEIASQLKAIGKSMVFYLAGQTPEGAAASASHTASVAGNYEIFKGLARQAGIIVAKSLGDFEDLTMMAHCFQDLHFQGLKLGALSNAGFECVTIADHLGPFQLSHFGSAARQRLAGIFEQTRINEIVDVRNPLDVTPMMNDAGYLQVMESLLDDPEVDVGVFGVVPLTPALNTLVESENHKENIKDESSIVQRIIGLKKRSTKPFIIIVDAGQAYDPMAHELSRNGVPVFGKMDRAIRLFGQYCQTRIN